MLELFQGVFDWGASPHDPSAFEQTVRRGGMVVSVDATSDEERALADRVMRESGHTLHSGWSTLPTR